ARRNGSAPAKIASEERLQCLRMAAGGGRAAVAYLNDVESGSPSSPSSCANPPGTDEEAGGEGKGFVPHPPISLSSGRPHPPSLQRDQAGTPPTLLPGWHSTEAEGSREFLDDSVWQQVFLGVARQSGIPQLSSDALAQYRCAALAGQLEQKVIINCATFIQNGPSHPKMALLFSNFHFQDGHTTAKVEEPCIRNCFQGLVWEKRAVRVCSSYLHFGDGGLEQVLQLTELGRTFGLDEKDLHSCRLRGAVKEKIFDRFVLISASLALPPNPQEAEKAVEQ
ncbi:unnamed protein product, partial [Polarella glacialis]